jgi:protein ImuA
LEQNKNNDGSKPMIPASRLHRSTPSSSEIFPMAPEPLEEIGADAPADVATAMAFGLARLAAASKETRPIVLVTTADGLAERGRPFAGGMRAFGLGLERLIWVRTRREGEALWALEEVLKSGAVAGGLALAASPPFVATRRLEFAAREGRAAGILLRTGPAGDLSAARRRWRISALASAPDAFDPEALGAPRLRAELLRRRDGPPGAWTLERDDETGGFRVVAGLAGHGLETGELAAAPNAVVQSRAVA